MWEQCNIYSWWGLDINGKTHFERSWRVWKLNAAYYPVTLVKTAELDPKKNHLVSCHPHGILCFGATVCDLIFLIYLSFVCLLRRLHLPLIHVDCWPSSQALWLGFAPCRWVLNLSEKNCYFLVGTFREHSCFHFSGNACFWLVGWLHHVPHWRLFRVSLVEEKLPSWRWVASLRWWWPPSQTRSSCTWARGKASWRWLWRWGQPWCPASCLGRLKRTTRAGRLRKSGTGLHALYAAALVLLLFSSQVMNPPLTFLLYLWN